MQLQSLNDTLSRDRDRLQALEREQNELMTAGDPAAPPVAVDVDAGPAPRRSNSTPRVVSFARWSSGSSRSTRTSCA